MSHFFSSLIVSLLLCFTVLSSPLSATKPPDLTPQTTTQKINEIMHAHATHKELTSELIKRILNNYLEGLDPAKTYFIESDIHQWLEPTDQLLAQILQDYKRSNFRTFEQMQDAMARAIIRRHYLEDQIDLNNLPKQVKAEEFKDLKWASSEQELLTRLTRIKALQIEMASKLNEDTKERSLQRIAKRQAKYEDEILSTNPIQKQRLILTYVLKATASALDTYSAYFTPEEAAQFMINVQQRLFGIGVQLRDDLNGFTVTKIIEGGPAAENKEMKLKDRIIAVNEEPVVGMDILDAVDLIRGEENTPVTLTVVRETGEGHDKKEEILDITLNRAQVVLKDTRFDSSIIPFGDGAIAYLRLHSFYQDPDSSSASDLSKELENIKSKNNVKGVILDLRSNAGGLLTQAVNVAGLFMTKGIVVSIKDDTGTIQHLRELESNITWNGPLIILINRASASASEIVAGTLQDYGRAIVVGDDHSFGKGSFQTFTLNTTAKNEPIDPEGEYKVTRGRYYTVSGKTPQLVGVSSDIEVPGSLSESEIGEKFAKYPLESDSIKPSFEDDLSDVPYFQRERIKMLYRFNLQPRLSTYNKYMQQLRKNSEVRIQSSKLYQKFLKDLKKDQDKDIEDESPEEIQNDLQLGETKNIMRDLLYLMYKDKK